MIEDCEDQKDNHEYQGSDSCSDSEESNQTDLGEVDTCEQLLQSSWINQALGVNLTVGDEEDVISVGEVEE